MRFSPRTWLITGILYISYIAYGTLLPFDFSFSMEMIENGLGNIEWVERYGKFFYTTKNVDAIANFIFFIPLGIIIYNLRYASGKQHLPLIDIGLATLFGLILSSSIEFLQLLIKVRTTSYIDVMMNTLGCLCGAIIAFILPRVFSASNMQTIGTKLRNLPEFIFILPILIAGLLLTEDLSTYFLRSEKIGDTIFNWQYIIQPIWIWQVLFYFIPLGMLATRLSKKSQISLSQPILQILRFFIALLIFAVIEILKFIIYADIISAQTIIFGITGILIGIAISEILGKDKSQIPNTIRQRFFYILIILVLSFTVLVFYKFSYPFKLSFKRPDIIEKSAFFLFSYYSIIPFTGIQKLLIYSLQNILLFIPMGVLLQELEYYMTSPKKGTLILFLAIFLIVFPLIIQIFNYNQTPFLYEIPTNALGISLGYSAWFSLRGNIPKN